MRYPHVAYSEEVARRVCEGWAAGEPMTRICREMGMPHPRTVQTWLRERADFRALFEAARARRMELFAREPGLAKRASGHLGRRSTYDEDVAAMVCARIASGESLRGLAQDPALPTTQTIYNWLAERAEFRIAFQAALDVRAEGLMEEALEIADDDTADLVEQPDGRLVPNHQAIRRARLMMEARRWFVQQTRPRTDWMDGRRGAAEREPEKGPCWEDLLEAVMKTDPDPDS